MGKNAQIAKNAQIKMLRWQNLLRLNAQVIKTCSDLNAQIANNAQIAMLRLNIMLR